MSKIVVFPGLSGLMTELAHLLDAWPFPVAQMAYPHWPVIRQHRIDKEAFLAHCRGQVGFGDEAWIGYSFGGSIAFALAAQLLSEGRMPPIIIMLDTPALTQYRELPPVNIARKVIRAFRNGVGGERVYHHIANALIRLPYPQPLDAMTGFSRARGLGVHLQINYNLLILRQIVDWMQALPEPLPLRAVLFRCTKQYPGVPHDLGWSRFIRDVEITEVPGDHHSILSPTFAPILKMGLSRFTTSAVSRIWIDPDIQSD